MGSDEAGLKRADLFAQKLPLSICPAPVLDWLNRQEAGLPMVVACSGGADSVALLLWLVGHFGARFDWVIAHIDHGTRGDASKKDAQWVEALAGQLGFRYEMRSRVSDESGEAYLRTLRWKALGEVIQATNAAGVFLGHHQDDVVENLLFRLSRGAGLEGLSGMRAVQAMAGEVPRLRPLLDCRREMLQTALDSVGQDWREDASNQTDAYLRNRIRKALVPIMDEVFEARDWREGFRRSHQQLDEAFDCIEGWAAPLIGAEKGKPLNRGSLSAMPVAVQSRVVECWVMKESGQVPGNRVLSEVLKTLYLGGAGKWSLGNGFLSLSEKDLFWTDATNTGGEGWMPLTVEVPFETKLPQGGRIQGEWILIDAPKYALLISGQISEASEVWLDAEKAGKQIILRQWNPGDCYAPLGTKGRKKLQDAFVDRKVESSKRAKLPVVCTLTGAILWVPGLPPAGLFKLETKTQFALRLTYEQG
mgnify:CR=1 FL=1